jgi:hypothetical protein
MPPNVNIEVRSQVKAQLKAYQTALESDFGRRASMGEILSALLSGTSPWQVVAMLDFYRPMDNPRPSVEPEQT